jgi:hypothetical protein
MKPIGLISQIFVIGLAIAVVALYVRPTFAEIGDIQNKVQEFSSERERVTETNKVLAARVFELESIAVNDRNRLSKYLPQLLDEVAVLRDIEIIAQNSGVSYSTIQHNGERIDNSEETRLLQTVDLPVQQEFTITVEGSYSTLKDFLSILEQNEYPLQVHTLQIRALDGGLLSADATVVTYITNVGLEVE